MDVGGMLAGASMLNRPAEEYENNADIEAMWVVKACEFADIHFNLISSAQPNLLRLTKEDDRIYTIFLQMFSNLETNIIKEDDLKSIEAKEKWRAFCEKLQDIEDHSFGTLLRLNAYEDYSEQNTILVTRVQFYAIEIDRNRKGYNNHIWNTKSTLSSAKNS